MKKHIKVEYDIGYSGGDYGKTGQFDYIPLSLVNKYHSVEAAFTMHTNHDAVHIVHYTEDELYDKDGNLIEDEGLSFLDDMIEQILFDDHLIHEIAQAMGVANVKVEEEVKKYLEESSEDSCQQFLKEHCNEILLSADLRGGAVHLEAVRSALEMAYLTGRRDCLREKLN